MELVKPHWDIDNLEKAYRHGFMAGMVGKDISACPMKADIIANAWEAGWQDGKEQFDIKHRKNHKKSL